MKKTSPSYVIDNCYKPKIREKSWKFQRNTHITYKGTTICITVGFSSETMVISEESGMALLKCWKKNTST